jgi:hypothetical protein
MVMLNTQYKNNNVNINNNNMNNMNNSNNNMNNMDMNNNNNNNMNFINNNSIKNPNPLNPSNFSSATTPINNNC